MARSRSLRARALKWLGFALAGWVGLTVLTVWLMCWLDPPTTSFMLRDRYTAWQTDAPGYRFRHDWVDWEQISPSMKLAVIAAEDQKFADHWGFDFASIQDALDERERGRGSRGASTITQQVAKNLFLWPQPSWLRKGIEAGLTLLIELLWSKERILEVYLNVAEFGRGVFGVGAASEVYFGKPAALLNPYESARLAAVLPSPKRSRVDRPSVYVIERQYWILGQMRQMGGTAWLERLD